MQTRELMEQVRQEHGNFFSHKERLVEARRLGYESWQIEEMLEFIKSTNVWDAPSCLTWWELELFILLADLPENQAEELREIRNERDNADFYNDSGFDWLYLD